ncbi:uncharacterized protein MYCFIDRAFT_174431 [Pseudocercospora fijiensis CIRAD86]|uniref:Uncharacterized protein n=1 Tax=Pseudocercospora fijiensis (strain CIRAD86) TaxID=383855 RepID=M3B0I0_PSEFD|nr:uncharacterized protein MYCFIDRAFT_174431 [Pseudocercospora fijiensis CIRAD86]EME82918.1 hypothetical protein MYCFIDRAFT_174431 [Pseudocercospora fijiensis CIRAD86]
MVASVSMLPGARISQTFHRSIWLPGLLDCAIRTAIAASSSWRAPCSSRHDHDLPSLQSMRNFSVPPAAGNGRLPYAVLCTDLSYNFGDIRHHRQIQPAFSLLSRFSIGYPRSLIAQVLATLALPSLGCLFWRVAAARHNSRLPGTIGSLLFALGGWAQFPNFQLA